MENNKFVVTKEQERIRLDVFLQEQLKEFSRSRIQKLIKGGDVLVNGEVSKSNYLVVSGDVIVYSIPSDEVLDMTPVAMDLVIVYEDSDVLVVNKPKGLVVHPGAGTYEPTLVHGLLAEIDDLSGINGVLRPGIVHRIDKDTSGLLIVAKNDNAHHHLAKQLEARTLKRTYLALVQGVIKHDDGLIDAPIGRDKHDRKKMAITDQNSKPAITHFKVLKRFKKYTLIECQLETGRTHQIRVHMQYIGFPILGDEKYSRKNDFGIKGQMLHAYKLSFLLPSTNQRKDIEIDLPDDFKEVLDKIGKEDEN